MGDLNIAGQVFTSRLLMGTGKYGDMAEMEAAVLEAGSELVTVALKRIETAKLSSGYRPDKRSDQIADHGAVGRDITDYLRHPHIHLLPNTSGARNAEEAVFAARLAREALDTCWIKLEIHPDPRYLLPDPVETLRATEILARDGFVVLPYIHADPVLCKRLEDVGTAAVMPLGSPIGSNRGLRTRDFLAIIIEQSQVPVIIDAGIGRPSDGFLAMEMGADAVLVNTAIATAGSPVQMAQAFRQAVMAGRLAYESGGGDGIGTGHVSAQWPSAGHNSSPMTAFLDSEPQ